MPSQRNFRISSVGNTDSAPLARTLAELTSGSNGSLEAVTRDAVVESDHDGMVLVRGIEIYSIGEHHLLPFFGRMHVAYVPDGRVLERFVLPRIVNLYARRIQLQERLTRQVAEALEALLRPAGVAVMIEATHLSTAMRGRKRENTTGVTTARTGLFRDDPQAFREFQHLVSGTVRMSDFD